MAPPVAPSDSTPVDAVVGQFLDGFRSGIARFNGILAERLDVPVLGLEELVRSAPRRPLLSFKVRELTDDGRLVIEEWLNARPQRWDVFLHVFDADPLELRLVEGARRVWCGNGEIHARLRERAPHAALLWAPGMILDDRPFPEAEVSVFSFGMAHKLQVDQFQRLRELLEQSGRTYAVYVSAATHETSTMRDAAAVFDEMHELFPEALFFLGNLSDVAVAHYLRTTTFFAAFFPGGVRANNTSVSAALDHGAVVVTNLDAYSPTEYVHLDTVVDVGRCDALPLDREVRGRIASRATEIGRARSWEAFLAHMRPSDPALE